LHTGQNVALDSGQTILELHLYALNFGQAIAHRAIFCPSFDTVITTCAMCAYNELSSNNVEP
jgi:hypothetical protein